MTAELEITAAGVSATIQDAGRADVAHLGVPRSGACDPEGLAVANALLDNDPAAACIEVTLGGTELEARRTAVIGLAGADLGAEIDGEGRRLEPGASHLVWAGSTVAFRGRASGAVSGVRAYVAVPGGFDVPEILGSASTCLAAGFGGVEGRPLRPGDILRSRHPVDTSVAGRVWPVTSPGGEGPVAVRVVRGPHVRRLGAGAIATLIGSPWSVGTDSDRMGARLDGPVLSVRSGLRASQPVVWGAIQVPAAGRPIVLLADHQTVGGYPVVAVVIGADLALIGQLAPGDRVSFRLVDLDEARDAARIARRRFAEAAAVMRRRHRHEDAWRSAGG